MKKLIILLIMMFITLTLAAQTRYVSSLKVKLYGEPVKSSQVVTTLNRGESLNVIKTEGDWLYVSAGSQKGWIQSLFTKTTKPSGAITILGNKQKTGRIKARERASSDVTAASARGLVAGNENAASRTRLSDDRGVFNPQDIETVESVEISETELIQFLSKGKVQ